ncbi:MAG: 30S ribosomal protein S7 [Solirubrobacterales bacterium]
MARRNAATIRPLEADTEFRSRLVQQVVNKVMRDGKKSLAEKITYDALAIVGERSGEDPVGVLKEAIDELTPQLEVRSRRVGGATYQVPVEVPDRRGRTLAVRWLVDFARSRGESAMSDRLANEILAARRQQGNAWKRKDDIFRMAQANKAFAHYRW